jgi:Uma2 family endonuclease
MAEPVQTRRPVDDLSDEPILQRWAELPDGSLEFQQTPLTEHDFLFPQEGDHWVQGRRHSVTRRDLAQVLDDHFDREPDVMVLEDVQVLLGPGLPEPCPDVSVIRGVKPYFLTVFDVAAEGVVPCLVIEIVSPKGSRIRGTDMVRKVKEYCRAGISEYLIVDRPGRSELSPFHLILYRRDSRGRYQRIEPDPQGRVFSETTNLWFSVSPAGDEVFVHDAATGEKLLTAKELREARRADEKRLRREEMARKSAEAARKTAEVAWKAAERAREAAEREADREAGERRAAEERAKTAEDELERLQEEMQRLRGGSSFG